MRAGRLSESPGRSRPRRDGRGRWGGRGEWGGDPVHSDDRGPVRARVCCAPFPSATPLDPPLYEKKRRSGG